MPLHDQSPLLVIFMNNFHPPTLLHHNTHQTNCYHQPHSYFPPHIFYHHFSSLFTFAQQPCLFLHLSHHFFTPFLALIFFYFNPSSSRPYLMLLHRNPFPNPMPSHISLNTSPSPAIPYMTPWPKSAFTYFHESFSSTNPIAPQYSPN